MKIEISQGIRPHKIQLISLSGAVVKSFEPDERLLDIQTIPSVFYFLKIEMEEGSLVLTKKANNGVGKKVVTIHGNELKGNGTYFYSLTVNGQIVDSKMMLYVAAE